MRAIIMPPKMGTAMGITRSEPRPVEVRDREQREQGGGGGHQARADAAAAGFDDCLVDRIATLWFEFVEALAQVGGHDHAVVGGDAESGEEADPDGFEEVDQRKTTIDTEIFGAVGHRVRQLGKIIFFVH